MERLRVLIVDDSMLWLNRGRDLLVEAGYIVETRPVFDPQRFVSETLDEAVKGSLKEADVLLVDKDFGQGVTSTRFICVVRHNFPKLPIIRWTGGHDRKPYMEYLGVARLEKPTRESEAKFVEAFEKTLNEQRLILSGPMGIFAALDEVSKPDEYQAELRSKQLVEIAQLAQLADRDLVGSGDRQYPFGITGRAGETSKHQLGHCICDGCLTAEDIRPYLPALQKVVRRFEAADGIDERFKICAEFIKAGNLDELELVQRCY